MRPKSKRFSALLCGSALSLSCAAAPQAASLSLPEASSQRRAPGVPELESIARPEPARSGESHARLLALRAPAPSELAQSTVRDFLRAIVNEDSDRLDLLFAPEAVVETGEGRQAARAHWRARFAQLDYRELKGQILFREAELETIRAEDLGRLPANRRVVVDLADDEVAVRVPIRISWVGRTRLFGDELLFRLRPAGSRFQITEIGEDFHAP